MFVSEIRNRRIQSMKSSRWRRHLDEMFVKFNGERHYLWQAMDHELNARVRLLKASRLTHLHSQSRY